MCCTNEKHNFSKIEAKTAQKLSKIKKGNFSICLCPLLYQKEVKKYNDAEHTRKKKAVQEFYKEECLELVKSVIGLIWICWNLEYGYWENLGICVPLTMVSDGSYYFTKLCRSILIESIALGLKSPTFSTILL